MDFLKSSNSTGLRPVVPAGNAPAELQSVKNQTRFLTKAVDGFSLSPDEAEEAMNMLMDGKLTPIQSAAFLTAMKMKGETEEELSSFAKVMRENAIRISPKVDGMLVDTCGTGGDSSGTFNISTTAAFIAAGAGVPIAKHGNRSVSSNCGSADVLEALGVKMLEPAGVEACISKIGIGFMFAPLFHPAMKNVMPVRKELGFRTFFNILGPITNPAGAQAQVVGVFSPELAEKIAHVLMLLGSKHALIVHSDGMDEFGLGKTKVFELKEGAIENYEVDAADLGFANSELPKPKTRKDSAEILLDVLEGNHGPARDCSVLNAAAAIYVSGRANSIADGVKLAADSIDSDKAGEKLKALIEFSQGKN